MNRYQLLIVLFVAVLVLVIVRVAHASSPRAVICDVFGPRCSSALRVAACETGGTFDPRALGSAGERGLFQIHPVHAARVNWARMFEPRYNALFAFRLSHGGRDWSAWTCRP